jgi:hypothetical protein
MLTTAEVTDSRIAGLPWPTLAGWVQKDVIKPTHPGSKGRGNSAKFSIMQAVGIAVAAELCRQPRGCQPVYVRAIVAGFSDTPEKKLLEHFKKGLTHFLTIHGPEEHLVVILEGPKYSDMVDVKAIYDRVMEVAKS